MAIENSITAPFDGMTWGDLRYLVERAEGVMDDDDAVDFAWDDEAGLRRGLELRLQSKQ